MHVRTMDAATILYHMAYRYATAAAYRDIGETFIETVDAPARLCGRFRTAFVRSKGLRFCYQALSEGQVRAEVSFRTHQGRIVQSGGNEPHERVEAVVARMVGVTLGVVQTVPKLLLVDEFPGPSIATPKNVARLDPAAGSIDGQDCWVIEVSDPGGAPDHRIFVRKRDRALRRIIERHEVSPTAGDRARSLQLDPSSLPPATLITTIYEPELFVGNHVAVDIDW